MILCNQRSRTPTGNQSFNSKLMLTSKQTSRVNTPKGVLFEKGRLCFKRTVVKMQQKQM